MSRSTEPLPSPAPAVAFVLLDADEATYEALCTSGVASVGLQRRRRQHRPGDVTNTDNSRADSNTNGNETTTSTTAANGFSQVCTTVAGTSADCYRIVPLEQLAAAAEKNGSGGGGGGGGSGGGGGTRSIRNNETDGTSTVDSANDAILDVGRDMDARLDVLEEVRLCSVVPVLPRTFPLYDLVQQVIPCTLRFEQRDVVVGSGDGIKPSPSSSPSSASALPGSSSSLSSCVLPVCGLSTILRSAQRAHLQRSLHLAGSDAAARLTSSAAITGTQLECTATTTVVGHAGVVVDDDDAAPKQQQQPLEGGSTTAATTHDGGVKRERGADDGYVDSGSDGPCDDDDNEEEDDGLGKREQKEGGNGTCGHRTGGIPAARQQRRHAARQRSRAWWAVSRPGTGAVVEWASTGAVGYTRDAAGLQGESLLRAQRAYYLPPTPHAHKNSRDGDDLFPTHGGGGADEPTFLLPNANATTNGSNGSSSSSGSSGCNVNELRPCAVVSSPPCTLRAAAALQLSRLAQFIRERAEYTHARESLPPAMQKQMTHRGNNNDISGGNAVGGGDGNAPPPPAPPVAMLTGYCGCHRCSRWQGVYAQLAPCTAELSPYLDHLHVAGTLPAFPTADGSLHYAKRRAQPTKSGNGDGSGSGSVATLVVVVGADEDDEMEDGRDGEDRGNERGARKANGTTTTTKTTSAQPQLATATVDPAAVFPALGPLLASLQQQQQQQRPTIPTSEDTGGEREEREEEGPRRPGRPRKKPRAIDERTPNGTTVINDSSSSSSSPATTADATAALLTSGVHAAIDDAVLEESVLIAVAPAGAPYRLRLLGPSAAYAEVLVTALAETLDRLMRNAVPPAVAVGSSFPSGVDSGCGVEYASGDELQQQQQQQQQGQRSRDDAAWCRAVHTTLFQQFIRATAAAVPARVLTAASLERQLRERLCCCRASPMDPFIAVSRHRRNGVEEDEGTAEEEEEEDADIFAEYLAAVGLPSTGNMGPNDDSNGSVVANSNGQDGTEEDAGEYSGRLAHLAAIRRFAAAEASRVRVATEDTLVDLILSALRPVVHRRVLIMYELLRLLLSKGLFIANRALVARYRAWYASTPSPCAVLRLMRRGSVLSAALARAFPPFFESVRAGTHCDAHPQQQEEGEKGQFSGPGSGAWVPAMRPRRHHASSSSPTAHSDTSNVDCARVWKSLDFVPESALLGDEYLERFILWVSRTHHCSHHHNSSHHSPTANDATPFSTFTASSSPAVGSSTAAATTTTTTLLTGGDPAAPSTAAAAATFSPAEVIAVLSMGVTRCSPARASAVAGFHDAALTAVVRSLVRRGRTLTGDEIDHFVLSTARV